MPARGRARPNSTLRHRTRRSTAGLSRVGLGAVVEELLGIHLAKEHSAADWSTRPLPQAWLVYAALDVELLVDVRDALAEILERDGKTDIAAQEFESVLARDFAVVRTDPWRRLAGLHSVRGAKNLAVARELWITRDAYAREIDTAPGRLVPDSALVAAARTLPETKRDLAALKEFTGRASRTQIDRWWAAIQGGRARAPTYPPLACPGDVVPPPRVWSDRNPEADRRLKAARAAVTALAEAMTTSRPRTSSRPTRCAASRGLRPNQLTSAEIALALGELGARAWQIDATAQVIADAFVEASQIVVEAPEPTS